MRVAPKWIKMQATLSRFSLKKPLAIMLQGAKIERTFIQHNAQRALPKW